MESIISEKSVYFASKLQYNDPKRTIQTHYRLFPAGDARCKDRVALRQYVPVAGGSRPKCSMHRPPCQHGHPAAFPVASHPGIHGNSIVRRGTRPHFKRELSQQQGASPHCHVADARQRLRRQGAIYNGRTHTPAGRRSEDGQCGAECSFRQGCHGCRYTCVQSQPSHRTCATIVHHSTCHRATPHTPPAGTPPAAGPPLAHPTRPICVSGHQSQMRKMRPQRMVPAQRATTSAPDFKNRQMRLRTRRAATTHSQGCDYALAEPQLRTHRTATPRTLRGIQTYTIWRCIQSSGIFKAITLTLNTAKLRDTRTTYSLIMHFYWCGHTFV